VEVAKIQLRDVARTWWLVEKMKQKKVVTWDQFSKSFYKRFFPDGIKRYERTIYQIALEDRIVDKYAAKLLRYSRFAPYKVFDEENQASRFQQDLKMKIKMFFIPQQPKTYSQIFTIAREVERKLEKKIRIRYR